MYNVIFSKDLLSEWENLEIRGGAVKDPDGMMAQTKCSNSAAGCGAGADQSECSNSVNACGTPVTQVCEVISKPGDPK